jgi:hypothetical protein
MCFKVLWPTYHKYCVGCWNGKLNRLTKFVLLKAIIKIYFRTKNLWFIWGRKKEKLKRALIQANTDIKKKIADWRSECKGEVAFNRISMEGE